jgi:glycosyltransferase involved in cell wall biosynthesis
VIDRTGVVYQSIFCSLAWPRHPGYFGGEIRDFHLIRRLLSLSRVVYFGLDGGFSTDRADVLGPHLDALLTPERIRATRAHLIDERFGSRPIHQRLISRLQRMGWPVPGACYPADATQYGIYMRALLRGAVQEAVDGRAPDFVFVSPQLNPMAMLLTRSHPKTRFILASYDVEAVRVRRLAESPPGRLARIAGDLEAARALHYERDNLAACDGVIAVSELDKQLFVSLYGYPPERILVVPNGVDPEYFGFRQRPREGGRIVIYTGSLNYPPNHQAALRLTDRIMPLVRRHQPEAALWVVGQNPQPDLVARHDGRQTLVTGQVADVRPYLGGADVACVPLLAGSGTKYKVLEALSSGLPVVCSPLAAEGLDLVSGEHILVAETDEELAASLVRLFEDEELTARLSRAGRRQVERLYSWDNNLSALDGWLAMLSRLPRYGSLPAGTAKAAPLRRRAA